MHSWIYNHFYYDNYMLTRKCIICMMPIHSINPIFYAWKLVPKKKKKQKRNNFCFFNPTVSQPVETHLWIQTVRYHSPIATVRLHFLANHTVNILRNWNFKSSRGRKNRNPLIEKPIFPSLNKSLFSHFLSPLLFYSSLCMYTFTVM